MTLPLQILGFFLLLLGIALGYWRWIRPRGAALDARSTGLLLLVVLMVMGGLIGSPFWWVDRAESFSWDLPPLASRMLAAAGWAFAAVGILVLERPTDRRLRLILVLLFVYLVPLAAAIFLFHLDAFDFATPVTIGFFTIVALMVLADVYYLLRQPAVFPDTAVDLAPPETAVRAWLIIVAVITALWGLALFLTDGGPSDLIWLWPGNLLTSRLIGVMLLTIAAGALYSLPARGTARPMLAMIFVYGLGIALANFWNIFAGKPVKLSYILVFAIFAFVSAVLLLRDRGLPAAAA